jgi:hypothetical protein
MPTALSFSMEMAARAVEQHLPHRTVCAVTDRGVWVRRTLRIELDGGEVVYLKADAEASSQASEKEAYICSLFSAHGLPCPPVLALDTSCTLLPAPFIIQGSAGGEKLGVLLDRSTLDDQRGIYRALGVFYKQLHSVHHAHSGWIQGAGAVLPFSPAAHQYQEVIVTIGAQAVAQRLLLPQAHLRLQRLWQANLSWLEQHTPSLVGGASHWSVYLEKDEDWQVTKIMDLPDVLFWDPAWDIASIRYPEFRPPLPNALWEEFASVYGPLPDEKRLKLYLLMRRLDAAMGNYYEPPSAEHEQWKRHVWDNFDDLLNEVEKL